MICRRLITSVRKGDAMKRLTRLDEAMASELKRAFIPKSSGLLGVRI